MDLPTIKPRVFLSHSKADIEFIQRLYDDLRHCQIDPWLDSEEIRHGQPWLDAIFESGIPTCDCVLVYLTPTSIESPMVKKEIDASIIKKLGDNRVAFLPYVSNTDVRSLLRADIQAIQTPEWNDANYAVLFPRVVAEIWHSFMDRSLWFATNDERAKRLEAELALERTRSEQGIFSEGDQKDFSFIHEALNRSADANFVLWKRVGGSKKEVIRTAVMEINVLALVLAAAGKGFATLTDYDANSYLVDLLRQQHGEFASAEGLGQHYLDANMKDNAINDLVMFGLLRNTQVTNVFGKAEFQAVFTDKMQRFRYWLAVNAPELEEVELKPKEKT